MSNLTAAALTQRILKLGLVPEPQLQEVLNQGDLKNGDASELLRALERKGYLTPWQSQKVLKGDSEGFFLGGYRLLYRIAAGSFGRVYRADEPNTGNIVAIKILRRRWSEDAHNVELFEREGKVGMSLRHPNIVQILAVSQDPTTKQYYIVMEFVEGGNLRDFLAIRKKLEPAEALRLLEDAAAGLAYAVSRGLTHRDMKLTNVLISSQGTAKLVDFGLAAVCATAEKEEDDTKVDRTVDYAGLERATGVKQGDVRSDIYFLGCVFYEMLSGRSPFPRTRDRHARMQKHRFDNVQPLNPRDVNAPPSVFHLLETMMSLDPSKRYQTPAQLLEAIREVRREVDGTAAPEGARGAVAQPTRSVFVIEQHERLQDAIRDKLKELGYRVLISALPERALSRYEQHPFDALIVDVGASGEEGMENFERIMEMSERKNLNCSAIVLLSEDQTEWAAKVKTYPRAAALVRPVTLKHLYSTLTQMVPPRVPS